MSIRIHKMIGYGCSAIDFEQSTGLNPFSEDFFDIFNKIKSLQLDQRIDIYPKGKDILRDIHNKKLIKASDLYHVSGYDEQNHVCFIPSADYANWYRWDDPIDYIVSSSIKDGVYDNQKSAEDVVVPLKKHLYPYREIPETIIWYLDHLDIMKPDVSKQLLIPMYMEWWS